MGVYQYGIKYALHTVSSHFGNIVARVCEVLLRRGPLPLQRIKEYTQLNTDQTRYSLLVLIQHNCVQAFTLVPPVGSEDGQKDGTKNGKKDTQYMVVVNNILHRTRFPKFMGIVVQELDEKCRVLFEGLLEHGRLTVRQIVEKARSSPNKAFATDHDVRESLSKLVVARFVERCPVPAPVLEPLEEQTKPKRKSKKIADKSESIEQRILEAATPMEALRFSLEENSFSSVIVGEKRKHDALQLDVEGAEQPAILRPNFEEFTRHLRNKACVENVRARLDDGAAIVLRAILEATSKDRNPKSMDSVPLTLDAIHEEVVKSEEGRSMMYDHIRGSLAQLGCSCGRGSDDLYSIDLKNIIELAQNEEVESIVLKRYGRDAYKMFRLLSMSGVLETDKIAETTLVEKKDASKILFKLWKDEYLQMEKITVSMPRQPQFLLWKVDKCSLLKVVLEEMYHAALNLNLRVAYELEKEKEVLSLPRDKRIGELKKKYDRLLKMRMLMETSLWNLDDAIMLFNDF